MVRTIERTKEGKGFSKPLEMQPDFQRANVWSEEQEIVYVETVIKGGATHARTIYLNCPDWKGGCSTKYKDFVCVDGLQRYTAIKKFVENKLRVFGLLMNEFEDYKILERMFHMKLNVNNLQNKKDVLLWYLQINDGGTYHTKDELDKVKSMLLNKHNDN